MSPRALLPVFTLPLLACAAQGGQDGGSSNLPGRGIAGWQPVATAERPFLLGAPSEPLLGGPSALVLDETVTVWLHRRNAEGDHDILRATSPLSGETFGNAELVLEGGHDPSVQRAPDGTFWMAYQDDAGPIALATSADGRAFSDLPVGGLAEGRARPSLVLEDDGRVTLYLLADDHLVRTSAPSTSDLTFGPETTVLSPGEGCLDTDGTPEPCWDAGLIADAEVRLARTANGRRVYRLFYAAGQSGPTDLGFAASYDGLTFSRYAFNPVLVGAYRDLSPTSVLAGGRYLLYWGEARDASIGGVSLAISAPDAVSDRW